MIYNGECFQNPLPLEQSIARKKIKR